MSGVSEGIWFPIADDNHPYNTINDQLADSIQPHEARFPIADIHYPLNPSLLGRRMISRRARVPIEGIPGRPLPGKTRLVCRVWKVHPADPYQLGHR
jgi:hypothetical protein